MWITVEGTKNGKPYDLKDIKFKSIELTKVIAMYAKLQTRYPYKVIGYVTTTKKKSRLNVFPSVWSYTCG